MAEGDDNREYWSWVEKTVEPILDEIGRREGNGFVKVREKEILLRTDREIVARILLGFQHGQLTSYQFVTEEQYADGHTSPRPTTKNFEKDLRQWVENFLRPPGGERRPSKRYVRHR